MPASFLERAVRDGERRISSYGSSASSHLNKAAMGNPIVGSGGSLHHAMDQQGRLGKHSEQYEHYRGWAYVAIKAIAQRLASLPVVLGRRASAEEAPALDAGGKLMKSHRRNLMPVHARTKLQDSAVELVNVHPLLDAVRNPNPIMVPWALMFTTAASIKLTGKSYWWLPRIDGKLQIWPLPSDWVTPVHTKDELFVQYKVLPPNRAGEPTTVPASEMAYMPIPDPSNPLGTASPLQSQSPAVATDEQIQAAQYRAFKNGIYPGVMLRVGRLPGMQPGMPGDRPVLSDEQRIEMIDLVQSLYGGVLNYNDPIILDGMIEGLEKFTHGPAEMDFQQSGETVKSRIFQAFGVNPIIVGEHANVGYAQGAVADSLFLENVINPLAGLIGQVMTAWIGRYFSVPGEELVLWLEEAKAQDRQQASREWKIGIDGTCVTKDEVRGHLLRLPPLKDKKEGESFAGKPPAPPMFAPKPGGAGKPEEENVPVETDEGEGEPGAGGVPVKPEPKPGDDGKYLVSQRTKDVTLFKIVRGVAVELHVKSVQEEERRIAAAAKKYFRKQQKSVNAKLVEILKDAPQVLEAPNGAEVVADMVFSPREWDEILRQDMTKPLVHTMATGAAEELGTVNSFAAKVVPNASELGMTLPPAVAQRVREEVAITLAQPYWSKINSTSRQEIVSALNKGIDEGMAPRRIARLVSDAIGDKDGTRSALIARSETTGALNGGHQQSMHELAAVGLITGKRWVDIGDRDVRGTHKDLSQTTVAGVDGMFNVGGFEAPYPGYYGLPAGERCNCRCLVMSVIADEPVESGEVEDLSQGAVAALADVAGLDPVAKSACMGRIP